MIKSNSIKRNLFTFLVLFIIVISLCKSQSPILWGVTENGGQLGHGTIFSYNASNGIEALRYNFDSLTGYSPSGSLLKGNNGLIYGKTLAGGTYGGGVLFSYDIATGNYTDLHDFGNGADGYSPSGSLIQASNGLIYGMTMHGGRVSNPYFFLGPGIIFSYDITSGVYTDIHDFGNGNDGAWPSGSLIQASDSLLYGMTGDGGPNDTAVGGDGIIFSYDITSGAYTDIHDFGIGTDGKYPQGSLIQANNGLLYGMTSSGGADTGGVIFSYDITSGTESVIHSFRDDSADGAGPYGSLIQAGNGLLYGMTFLGGSCFKEHHELSGGTIFSYNISTNADTVLHSFGCGTDGFWPFGTLVQASDSLLYGMTFEGGLDSTQGTIFSYNISTGTETVLHNFNGADGAEPNGNLIEDDLPTGINEPIANNNELQIFPNPSSGQFNIKLPRGYNNYPIVEIYNVLGEKIEHAILNNMQNNINIGNQPAGIYFIYLNGEENALAGKVLIIK